MARRSNAEIIELELSSCIQKLAFLRGNGMTPRSYPQTERDVIEAFGLACCRRMADELRAQADEPFEPSSMDEDTTPGWPTNRKGE